MPPMIRRLLMLPIAVFALVAVIGMIGAAHAQGDADTAGQDLDGTVLDYVPVRGDTVNMGVRAVWMEHEGAVYAADATRGVVIKSQNKLPLGGIPFLGDLFDSPYERADLSDAKKVADVYATGEFFVLALPDYLDVPGSIAVINQANAFIFRQAPQVQSDGLIPAATGAPVGGAFYHAGDDRLLILIRPSVITDSALF